MVVKLTFDTNCILREEDKNKPYFNQIKTLEQLQSHKLVEIYKTDVQDTEIGDFPPRIEKSSEFKENLGVGVYDCSRFDHCVFGSEEDKEELNRLKNEQKPTSKDNDMKDIMTLHTHKKYNNDYLITTNVKDFNFDKHNVNVVNPVNIIANVLENVKSEDELKKHLDEVKE